MNSVNKKCKKALNNYLRCLHLELLISTKSPKGAVSPLLFKYYELYVFFHAFF